MDVGTLLLVGKLLLDVAWGCLEDGGVRSGLSGGSSFGSASVGCGRLDGCVAVVGDDCIGMEGEEETGVLEQSGGLPDQKPLAWHTRSDTPLRVKPSVHV